MKGIKRTLTAGILACTALQAHAEVSPWGFGVKGGVSGTSFWGYGDDLKLNGKKSECAFLQTPMLTGGIYGEYACSDYIGFELGVNYLKRGGVFTSKKEQAQGEVKEDDANADSAFIKMATHGISIPFSLCVYPMGRQEEEGIFKVFVGGSIYTPLGNDLLSFKNTGKNADGSASEEVKVEDLKNKLSKWDIAGHLGLGYELPFGLSIEGRGSMGFINTLASDKTEDNNTIFSGAGAGPRVEGLTVVKSYHLSFGLAYNVASLFTA